MIRFVSNINETARQDWLQSTLAALPSGSRILDVGAGELKNRQHCDHLNYVSQDFCQYQGAVGGLQEGLQCQHWDTSRVDIVSDIIAIPEPDANFGQVNKVVLCNVTTRNEERVMQCRGKSSVRSSRRRLR